MTKSKKGLIDQDEYGTVINSSNTFKGLAEVIDVYGSIIIAWTEGEGTQYDILFTDRPVYRADNTVLIQGGVKPNEDLFVSIMRKGAFSFKIDTSIELVGGYVAEKLHTPSGGGTNDALADLINGVCKELNKIDKANGKM